MSAGEPLDIPTFLRRPLPDTTATRVLDAVAPPLCFEMDKAKWAGLRFMLGRLRWVSRYRRAAAWGGEIGVVLESEIEAEALTQWATDDLAACGVEEASARAWLRAYRHQAEAEAQREFEEG